MARTSTVILLFALCVANAFAGPTVRSSKDGRAIDGYDAVAYFTKKAAVMGSPDYSHDWAEVKWFFSSAEHRDQFAASPEKYAPQYGGYCAYGIASGYISKKVGYEDAWMIDDGKLYMFPDRGAQSAWNRTGGRSNVHWADQNWPKLKATLEARPRRPPGAR